MFVSQHCLVLGKISQVLHIQFEPDVIIIFTTIFSPLLSFVILYFRIRQLAFLASSDSTPSAKLQLLTSFTCSHFLLVVCGLFAIQLSIVHLFKKTQPYQSPLPEPLINCLNSLFISKTKVKLRMFNAYPVDISILL